MRVLAGAVVLVAGATALIGAQSAAARADAAFAAFLQAASTEEATAAIEPVLASGVSFDDALGRLQRGRRYADNVPRGLVQASHRLDDTEYFYTLDIPEGYDPGRRYPVRVQLHGGVGRIEQSAPPRAGSNTRLSGAGEIHVVPSAWRDAPWWSRQQLENLRVILDRVKRLYNVDENRVALAGVSDGGTGAYYVAMRETTPFASFLPFIGFIGVLRNEMAAADGDVFANNLLNKPLFVVNGGRDPQYPTSLVDPYIEHLRKSGVVLEYRPQPDAAHDTSWWPLLKDTVEAFVASHPRQPLPDRLTWQSGDTPGRAHWLVIDRLAAPSTADASLPDVNRRTSTPEPDFGIRTTGARINRVIAGSNAAIIGLHAGDTLLTINNLPVAASTDVAELVRGLPGGRPLLLTLSRAGETVRVTGRYTPTILPGEAETLLPSQGASGRVDLTRRGNVIEATTRGVGAFRLLISSDQFDLRTPIVVTVNGQPAFEGVIQPDLRTLLTWAARDLDRTMLFSAELPIALNR